MSKPKLTDEELSRVLGMADAGLLSYWAAASYSDKVCMGGAAYGDAIECVRTANGYSQEDHDRAWDISSASASAATRRPGSSVYGDYPEGPDSVLRFLENKGLA